MSDIVLNAHRRMRKLPFACALDIAAFFDSITWRLADRTIDRLPADGSVKDLLSNLVRVPVIERQSGSRIERARGLPQGLSISPTLANLVLDDFDKQVAHALSRLGAVVRRYCDDILVLASSMDALSKAVATVRVRLARLGLDVKEGTGRMVDTGVNEIEWLGISFGPDGLNVSASTIREKSAGLQAKVDQGVLDSMSVEEALFGLHQHYRRIIAPGRAKETVASVKQGMALNKHPNTRKEDLERLHSLIDDRHHCGQPISQDSLRGEPDGGSDQQRGVNIQDRDIRASLEKHEQW